MVKMIKQKRPAAGSSRRAKRSTKVSGHTGEASRFDRVFEKIYRLVLRIPRGRVMTYGQIAMLLEERYSPRLVGWAMHATPHDERNIPWHRVINSRGGISTGRVIPQEPELQRLLLEAEGVKFDPRGHCDLHLYQWSPGEKRARSALKAARQSLTTSRKRQPSQTSRDKQPSSKSQLNKPGRKKRAPIL